MPHRDRQTARHGYDPRALVENAERDVGPISVVMHRMAHAATVSAPERELAAESVVPLTWYDVPVALWEAPNHRLRPHESAREVVLSRSCLTRLVDRLEAAALLRREASPDDRRGAYAVLTKEGRAAQLRARSIDARGIATHFADHLLEEATILANALVRISASARAS